MDLDSKIGFWIQNVPYVWSEGETVDKCRRFYLVDHEACAVFDSKNRITTIPNVGKALFLGGVKKTETFCLLPLSGEAAEKEGCDVVRNYFLALHFWNTGTGFDSVSKILGALTKSQDTKSHLSFMYPVIDVRIEGVRVTSNELTYNRLPEKRLVVVQPSLELGVYPVEFGDTPAMSLRNPLTLKGNVEKEMSAFGFSASGRDQGLDFKRFQNLNQVKTDYDLTKDQLRKIHEEALRCPQQGWCYAKDNDINTTNLIYETIVGARPSYWVRRFD